MSGELSREFLTCGSCDHFGVEELADTSRVTAIAAWYTASALMLESSFGRPVLPVGKLAPARTSPRFNMGIVPPLRGNIAEQLWLNARDELHLARTNLILQETIYVQRTLGVRTIHNRERIEGYAIAAQHLRSRKNFGKIWLAIVRPTIDVV